MLLMCCWQLLLALHAIYYLVLKTQEGLCFHRLIQIDEMHDSNVLLKKNLNLKSYGLVLEIFV